ncbi:MAG: response regulator [Nitrospirota bacterium]
MIVPCECGAKLRLDDSRITEKGVKVRCPRCGNILLARKPAPPPAAATAPATPAKAPKAAAPASSATSSSSITVLVAHESEAVRNMIRDVLLDAEYKVETAAEGVEALKKATEVRPQVMVLDVGLPGIYGFELCERLKDDNQTREMKILLLTSTYDMSRYKRPPVSLYGADDYIEKHHVADQLALKIRKLIHPEEYAEAPAPAPEAESAPPGPEAAPAAIPQPPAPVKPAAKKSEEDMFSPSSLLKMDSEAPAPAASASSASSASAQSSWLDAFIQQAQDGAAMAPDSIMLESSIFEKRESDIPSVDESDPRAVEKAKRFARIIVSDIALYNQEAVSTGIRNGTFFELLKEDVEEGRRLYDNRVPETIRQKKDFYQEAFDNFIEAQKKIVR